MTQSEKFELIRTKVSPVLEELYEQWREYEKTAIANMRSRRANGHGHFIAVAAQHPLEDGLRPGPEFRLRLDLAYSLYRELRRPDMPVEIYVPGSRHQKDGVADKVSLSEAGCRYLLDLGVPVEDLHGQDIITRYKGSEGVYNAQDEAYTATRFFIDGNFARMHVACSVNQVPRSLLTYLQLGLYPTYHTTTTPDPGAQFHGVVYETFIGTPLLFADGNAYQGKSLLAEQMRNDRNPDLAGTTAQ